MEILMLYFMLTTAQFNLPQGLLNSVCYVETRHNINAIHLNDGQGNSIGICQIKLKTAKMLGFKGDEKQLMDPQVNIHYAGKYLSRQIKRYKGSTVKGIISYNQGHAGSLTTTSYSAKVIKQW